MPKHKRGFIPNKYGVIQREVASSGGDSGGGDAVATRNILNGVLNCAWDKTSATPKLLEIYDTSKVKLNIDADNPLVMAFANGWDDKDRPAQVLKRLATAPANIDLSGKANCHVQICAKVINDELVITTHDIYDPAVGYGSNIAPDFGSGVTQVSPFSTANGYLATKDGWSVWGSIGSALYDPNNPPQTWPYRLFDRTTGKARFATAAPAKNIYFTAPALLYLTKFTYTNSSSFTGTGTVFGWDSAASTWDQLAALPSTSGTVTLSAELMAKGYDSFYMAAPASHEELAFYEAPTAKFYRSLNKVKDRSDVEQLWINLGYATVDGNGVITALHHYTDLRNNYPGGMRVEA